MPDKSARCHPNEPVQSPCHYGRPKIAVLDLGEWPGAAQLPCSSRWPLTSPARPCLGRIEWHEQPRPRPVDRLWMARDALIVCHLIRPAQVKATIAGRLIWHGTHRAASGLHAPRPSQSHVKLPSGATSSRHDHPGTNCNQRVGPLQAVMVGPIGAVIAPPGPPGVGPEKPAVDLGDLVDWFCSYFDFTKLWSRRVVAAAVSNAVLASRAGYAMGLVRGGGTIEVREPKLIRIGEMLPSEEIDMSADAVLLEAAYRYRWPAEPSPHGPGWSGGGRSLPTGYRRCDRCQPSLPAGRLTVSGRGIS